MSSDFLYFMAVVGAVVIPAQIVLNVVLWGSLSLLRMDHQDLFREHKVLKDCVLQFLKMESKAVNQDLSK